MSDRQCRVLQVLGDPMNRGVTQLSRGDCAAIARCLAERDKLLRRVEVDAELLRAAAALALTADRPTLAKYFEGQADDVDRIISGAEEGGAL